MNNEYFPNQADYISVGNLCIKYCLDPIFLSKIKPSVCVMLNQLIKHEDDFKVELNVETSYEIFYGGPIGIIACTKDPIGEVTNFANIRDFRLEEIWFMYIDVKNWHNDPLPARFLKHSVSYKQILEYLFAEMGYFNDGPHIPTEILQ
jgi:hypothetical protein